MINFKRILVGLDLTEMDGDLLPYVAYFSRVAKSSELYFYHFARDFKLEPELHEQLKEHVVPVDEAIEAEMRAKVEKYFQESSRCKIHYKVIEGSSYKEILKWSELKNIDLIIAGRKKSLKGSGLMPNKLVKYSSSHMLFITEGAQPRLDHIMVPVDFSDFAGEVVNTVLDLKENLPGSKITIQHTYNVPIGYYKTGKSYKEFASVIRKHASSKYKNFINSLNRKIKDVKPAMVHYPDKDEAETIYQYARRNKVSLIVMGSYGRNSFSSFILGSIAEKVMVLNNRIPMLVLKRKSSLSFFEAFKKI